MNHIDVMKQALEALLAATPVKAKDPQLQADAIVALREALAEQPAQQQEPVAWMWKDGTITSDPDRADGTWTPLYTSPPASKPWVGLDQHDIDVLFLNEDGVRFARYIEAKLKEKNT